MGKKTAEKQRLKRKSRQKERRLQQSAAGRGEKLEYLAEEAEFHLRVESFGQALTCLREALKIAPRNADLLRRLGYVGRRLNRPDVEFEAYDRLMRMGQLDDPVLPTYCRLLHENERFQEAADLADEFLARLPQSRIQNKRPIKTFLRDLSRLARGRAALARAAQKASAGGQRPKTGHGGERGAGAEVSGRVSPGTKRARPKAPPAAVAPPEAASSPAAPPAEPLPEIPVTVEIQTEAFAKAWESGRPATEEAYDLALDAYRIRLNETFDHLVCLSGLRHVRSLWYQEETARKVLKRFRGRALLADEVGLGKTIEALMVFSEYHRRGMIKSGLILTPTPLVSQWQEELASKFDLALPSTDDPGYRSGDGRFWRQPFVLASINQAKSAKNFGHVTDREYDIVIVDEAHHLKNRATLNWKLVNALKKKYLLMLTATPVENNLMELYNLVTLLKPGQLRTATAFREEFMTRGDPTDPQNREKLKELLGEVMIRNTRAVARIDIPPRFAQTIRVESTGAEKELYDRVSALVRDINARDGEHHRLLLKNLLAEAGSSPQAVARTLTRQLAERDFTLAHENEIRAILNLCRTMDHTRKNRALLDLIKANPGKLIVFVKYLGTLEHLCDCLSWERIPFALFHGGMDNPEKDRQIDAFRRQTDILLTTEIGGEGRNLQFCSRMVNYDLPWNPMKIEQRIGRIHRLGQEKEVHIFNLCSAGSLEDYILDVLDKKINMFEMVIGEIDMILGRVRGEQDFSDMVYEIWLNAATESDRKAGFDQLGAHLKRSKAGYRKTQQLDDALFGENYEL